jgi:exodeoxyribonuclease VII large subunit
VSPSAEHLGHRLRAFEQRLCAIQVRHLAGLRNRFRGAARHLALLHPLGRIQRRQQQADELARRLSAARVRRLEQARGRLYGLAARLAAASPGRAVERMRLAHRALDERLARALIKGIESRRARLALAVEGLQALSPLATLSRGYALVRRLPDGRLLTDAAEAAPGDRVEARLARGRILARVEATEGEERQS